MGKQLTITLTDEMQRHIERYLADSNGTITAADYMTRLLEQDMAENDVAQSIRKGIADVAAGRIYEGSILEFKCGGNA